MRKPSLKADMCWLLLSPTIPRFALLAGFLACLTLAPVQATAQDPEAADTLATDTSERTLEQQLALVESLRSSIEQTLAQQGSYSVDVLPTLNQLSEALLDLGDIEQASEIIEQQIQILKINDGLYTDDQIPLILQQLEALTMAGDWQTLNSRVDHLVWLLQRSTTLSTTEQLSALKTARDWYRLLVLRGPQTMEALNLLQLRELERRAIELAVEAGADAETMAALHYDLALAELYIALGIAGTVDTSQQLINRELGPPQANYLRPWMPIRSTADLEAVYGARVSTVIERSHRSAMMRHVQTLRTIEDDILAKNTEALSATEQARSDAIMTLHQGDSMLLRQQYELRGQNLTAPDRGTRNIGPASSHYATMWELLQTAGYTTDQLNSWFACPALLPLGTLTDDLEFSTSPCQSDENGNILLPDIAVTHLGIPGLRYDNLPQTRRIAPPEGISATLQFEVGVNGQAERIRVIEAEPDTTAARVRGRDALRTLQFRPRLENGRATRSGPVLITVFVLERK